MSIVVLNSLKREVTMTFDPAFTETIINGFLEKESNG